MSHSYRYALNDARQLTLGGLIAALEAVPLTYDSHGTPKPKHVYFDFGLAYPVRLTSYRGSYAELAITFGHSGFDDHGRRKADGTSWSAEAPAFLIELKHALTTEFYGYKGGEYRMDGDTPVWVAQWGEAGYTAVVGVRDIGAEVVLDTAWCEF